MRWVTAEQEFKKLLIKARMCVFVDSGREQTTLKRLTFDDGELCTIRFAGLLQLLMELSDDTKVYYVVLCPDPVHYFHRHFNRYPVIELTYGDSEEDYLKILNEDPGGSPADALSTNSSMSVILPSSSKWFGHLLKSANDKGGHLWIPLEWVSEIVEKHPFLRD